jgi:putative tricarboxylic transport membrane protein
MFPIIGKSSVIGTWIGALPGEGGAIAALLAYDSAKRTVKNPSRPFGTGAYEGVVAPEVSNNAAIGGALTTLLTLGVPGDAVTAVMIGAFMVHGLRPGPMLMEKSADLFWFIVWLLFFGNIMFLFIGLIATKYIPRFIFWVKKTTLMPIVAVLCVIGAYALQGTIFDVYLMIACGLVGYLLKRSNFPIAPLIIGLVLGPIGDGELRRAIMSSEGNFFATFMHHPIAIGLILLALWQVLNQAPGFRLKRRQLLRFVKEIITRPFNSR